MKRDVAGPYRLYPGRTSEQNIRQARDIAIDLWNAGHTAICPHLNTSNFENDTRLPDEAFLAGDLEILARCDAVVLTPDWEMSQGARGEVERANQLAIPCYVYSDKPQLRPPIGSLWRNRKTKDVYQVRGIAIALKSDREFVVYSENPAVGKYQYYVQHTEQDLVGLFFHQSPKPLVIDWDYDDDSLEPVAIDAWARPLEMWGEKFTRALPKGKA